MFVCCVAAGPIYLHHPITTTTAAATTHAGHSTSSVCVCVCLPCFVAVVIEYQIEQKIIPPPPSITEERPSQSRSFLWSRKKWWLGSKTSELWNCSVFLIVLPHARRLQRGWKGVKAELDTSTKNGNVYGSSTPHLVCTGLEIVLFLFTPQLVPIIHRLKKFLVQNSFL